MLFVFNIMSLHLSQPSLEALPDLLRDVEETRKKMGLKEWRQFVSSSPEIRRWRYFLCHDPYTRWGVLKPRGYSGDARVMDFAYRHPSVQTDLKQSGRTGQAIYRYTSGCEQSVSARKRIDFIVCQVNKFVEDRGPKASKIYVASYACGHGRELEFLSLETLRAIECFYAIDTDSDALDEIQTHQVSCR
jgi:hypothetical protein